MQEHIRNIRSFLRGKVTADKNTCQKFACDASIFEVCPQLIIYPKDEQDIKRVARYLAISAQNGAGLALTVRGKGSDRGGGALGDGVIMVTPASMNHLISINKNTISVQSGMRWSTLREILHSHDRFLPPAPESANFSTIGGAVANNAAGINQLKYGSTCDYIDSMRVVLSNGEEIRTGRLNKKDLEAKKKLDNFEGHIYRNIDYLLEENAEMIANSRLDVAKNNAGYNVWDVKRKDGSFDLSPLVCGSQGTLAIVTDISLRHLAYRHDSVLVAGFFETTEKAVEAIRGLIRLHPSALEMVDARLIRFAQQHHNYLIDDILPERLPEILLLVSFDDSPQRKVLQKAKRTENIFKRLAYSSKTITKLNQQSKLWRLRHDAVNAARLDKDNKVVLPVVEDVVVPLEKTALFLHQSNLLIEKHKLPYTIWGHAGTGIYHLQPLMSEVVSSNRKKIYDLMAEFYRMVIELGGSVSGNYNDGRLRAPYIKRQHGVKMYELFYEIKQTFDPLGYLNPGVKLGVTATQAAKQLRQRYSLDGFHEYLPNVNNQVGSKK